MKSRCLQTFIFIFFVFVFCFALCSVLSLSRGYALLELGKVKGGRRGKETQVVHHQCRAAIHRMNGNSANAYTVLSGCGGARPDRANREGRCSQEKGTTCAEAWVWKRTTGAACDWSRAGRHQEGHDGEEGGTDSGRLDGAGPACGSFPAGQTPLTPTSRSLGPPTAQAQLQVQARVRLVSLHKPHLRLLLLSIQGLCPSLEMRGVPTQGRPHPARGRRGAG